jgi:hypothetical protein
VVQSDDLQKVIVNLFDGEPLKATFRKPFTQFEAY